jgi:glutamine synthetase type III
VFDRGCFHGLNGQERVGYAAGVTQLSAPGATLLMMCFARNDVRIAPAGADEEEVVHAFDGWELVSSQPDSGPAPSGPLRHVPRSWYRFVRR